MKKPNAFTLLCLIALRARRSSTGLNADGLQQGQALIGDHRTIGLSRQQYRTAKSWLETNHLITTKATSKGTIATLINSDALDINAETATTKSAGSQPASNHQATTNKNNKNIRTVGSKGILENERIAALYD